MNQAEQEIEHEVANDLPVAEQEEQAGAAAEAAQELERARAEAAEYLDNWRRTAAELSNARKRMLREQTEFKAQATARVLQALLPIMDDIDRAFEALPPEQANSEWVEGFRLIQRKLQALLENEGVVPIATEGQMFDPMLHHAITHEEHEGFTDGQIIAEVARGYKLNDKVLRPSMVRVAKGS